LIAGVGVTIKEKKNCDRKMEIKTKHSQAGLHPRNQ